MSVTKNIYSRPRKIPKLKTLGDFKQFNKNNFQPDLENPTLNDIFYTWDIKVVLNVLYTTFMTLFDNNLFLKAVETVNEY